MHRLLLKAIFRNLIVIISIIILSSCSSTQQRHDTAETAVTENVDVVTYDTELYDDEVDEKPQLTASEKIARFFSRENQREVPVDGDPYARLETREGPGRAPRINTSRINRGKKEQSSVEFVGSLSSGGSGAEISGANLAKDKKELKASGSKAYNSRDKVSINYDSEPLALIVEQLLGGLLAANYVTVAELAGSVTFQTQKSIYKYQVPAVVRDILARNGYVMKLINGVYQIGVPEVIQQLEANAAFGKSGDLVSRVINLKRGEAEEIASVVAGVLPLGASVTPVQSSNAIILRASLADISSILELVNTLSESGAADNLVAIIPLNESPPEQVAASLLGLYSNNGTLPADIPVVIPLENQQSLLVGVKSKRAMSDVRRLLKGLDRDLRDQPSLRIIPLKHLPADEIATQLNAIFGNGANPVGAQTADNSGAPNAAPAAQGNEGADANEGGDSVQAPAIVRRSSNDRGQGSPNASRFRDRQDELNSRATAGAAVTAQVQTDISIVPDNRNNALLVYANFKQFKRLREVVRSLDLPLAQVVIEATIVEVDINDELGYGVQWFLQGQGITLRSSENAQPGDPGTAGGVALLNFGVGSLNATVVLEALQAVTDVQIISSPYLTVLDGRAARLSIGDQIPFVTATSTSNANGVTVTNQVEVRDTGIILEVTPRVGVDNSVLLNINQEVSSVRPGGAGVELTPTISQRSINSDVVVKSGRTILLGGLIQDTATKTKTGVPVVSKIPIFGELFKQTQDNLNRTELLVMITPRVIRKASQLENITRQLRYNLSSK